MPVASVIDRLRTCVLGLIVLAASTPAGAAKTDVIVLNNGDRFTGEVKQLTRGQLKVATDDAGTIYIEWDKVVAVTTSLEYDVVVTTGGHLSGRLAPRSSTALNLVAANGSTMVLPFLDIVSVAPLKAGFLERIDGTLDAGGSYTKSSGVGQLNVDLDAGYRRPSYEVFTDALSNLTRQSGAPAVTQYTVQSGVHRYCDNGDILTPFVYLARNIDLGLSFGTAAGFTGGRYLQRTNRSEALVALGAAAGREQLIDGRVLNDVDGVVSVAASSFRHDYPRTALDLSLLVFPELNRWGRVRSDARAKVKRELFGDFITTITAYDTFDSEPQVAGVRRNDAGVSLSIGWTF